MAFYLLLAMRTNEVNSLIWIFAKFSLAAFF
jgi:hypothetical protein